MCYSPKHFEIKTEGSSIICISPETHTIWSGERPTQNENTAKVYRAYGSSRECQIGKRRDQNVLAKLRTGNYKGLRAYKSLSLRWIWPHMPLCNQELQNLQHWLQKCPATQKLWLNLFGEDSRGLSEKTPCTSSCLGEENSLLLVIIRFLYKLREF